MWKFFITRFHFEKAERVKSNELTQYLIDSLHLLECYKVFIPNNYRQGRHHDKICIPYFRMDVLAQQSMTKGIGLLIDILGLLKFSSIALNMEKKEHILWF